MLTAVGEVSCAVFVINHPICKLGKMAFCWGIWGQLCFFRKTGQSKFVIFVYISSTKRHFKGYFLRLGQQSGPGMTKMLQNVYVQCYS